MKLFLLSAFLILAGRAEAATINAASCSATDVQTAINTAADGDKVVIPSCTATTWTTTVNMTNKAVDVEGAGTGQTNIALSGAGSGFSMSGTCPASNVSTLGNITWSGTSNDNGWISVSTACKFRLHHMAIGQISNRAIEITTSFGLIDHMTFTGTTGYNAIQVLGSQFTPSGRWSQAMAWGSSQGQNAVYIEDSTFTLTGCVTGLGVFDGFNGSKIVFRHNTVTNWQSYVHGFDSASESALQTDIYSNTYDMAASNCAIDRMIFIRGGTGYVHDNTMHLSDPLNLYNPGFLSLYYYRDTLDQQGAGVCNGSSSKDQNTAGQSGYICFQQPGTGGPNTFTSVPWYEFNNVGTGNMPANLQIRNESTHVVLGRDYFQDTAMPGYTAFTYPHPLQGTMQAHPRLFPSDLQSRILAKKAASNADWTATLASATTLTSLSVPTITITGATNSSPVEFTITETIPWTNPANCLINTTCMEVALAGGTGAWAGVNDGTQWHGWAAVITGTHTFTIYNYATHAPVDSTTFGSFAGQTLVAVIGHSNGDTEFSPHFNTGFFNWGYRGSNFYNHAYRLALVAWAKRHDGDADANTYVNKAKELYNYFARCGPAGITTPVEVNGARGSGSGYPARFLLTGMALLYDFLYNDLTTQEKTNGVVTLDLWATGMENQGYIATPDVISNFATGEFLGSAWAGYAIFDEDNTKGQNHINWASNYWNTKLGPEFIYPNGAVSSNFKWESSQYGGQSMTRLLEYYNTVLYNTGTALLTQAQLKELALGLVYDRRPDKVLTDQHSTNSVTTSIGILFKIDTLVLSHLLAGTTEGGYMQQMLTDWGPKPGFSSGAENLQDYENLVYYDSTRATADYTTLPPNHFIGGRGAIITRGWNSTDLWILHDLGVRQGIDHNFRGSGSMEIVRGNDRVLASVNNQDTEYNSFGPNASGNTLFFIDDKSYDGISGALPTSSKYYGGQQVWGDWVAPVYKLGSNYSFIMNDLTTAYNPTHINTTQNNQSKRTMKYYYRMDLDTHTGTIITWDRMKASSSAFTKALWWHFLANPTLVNATTYQGVIGSSSAAVQTVLPTSPTITKVQNGTSTTYHIEVVDPTVSTDLNMLTVISVGASTDIPPTAATITTDAAHVGVQVPASTPIVAIFPTGVTAGLNFTYTSDTSNSVTFTSTHAGSGRYFVTGLTAGNYAIARNGVTQSTGNTVGSDGVLAFTSSSGSFQVGVDVNPTPPPDITTTSLPGGTVNSGYSATITVTGQTPITCVVTSGALPTGLSLNLNTCAITGTPVLAGTFNFTVTASNVGGSDFQSYTVVINPVNVNLPNVFKGTSVRGEVIK